MLTMATKSVLSKARSATLALYILTLSNNSRFEFIFTDMSSNSSRKFASVFDIHRWATNNTHNITPYRFSFNANSYCAFSIAECTEPQFCIANWNCVALSLHLANWNCCPRSNCTATSAAYGIYRVIRGIWAHSLWPMCDSFGMRISMKLSTSVCRICKLPV